MKNNNISNSLSTLIIFSLILFLAGCGGAPGIKRVLKKQTPYEKYVQGLRDSGLEQSALGREWIRAGETAWDDSLYIPLPFSETGYFKAEKPSAAGYRFKARRGEVLILKVAVISQPDTQFFIDLFEVERATSKTKYLVSGDTSQFNLEYEIEEDQDYLIRLQPELLRGGQYTITVVSRPALAWPVQSTNQAVGSMFGVDRDGGRRRHEGIDIFAAKGTPAIAAVRGIVSRVNENKLGGKVVWISDMHRGQSLYYAHLDTQMVRVGQRVMPGDTVGLIGNTGNAISTAPHLHFGIYRFGKGAFDPAPFVFQSTNKPLDIMVDIDLLGTWARTSAKTSNLRSGPDLKAIVLKKLPQHTPVLLKGGIDNWFKVVLPDGSSGYISSTLVESTEAPIDAKFISEETFLYDIPGKEAVPVGGILEKARIEILALYGNMLFVKSEDGLSGWIFEES
ncbi:MAG: M23 family metallopeptidase [Bacteroidota bacterium]|nr:M23 family metallopeptidase [Bacteroidota bacterium]